jgi:hypothetical protein
MSTQGSKRLKIVNDQPSVEKLWNGRFRLEFFCFNEGKKKDWYGDNIDRILPAFGIKMGDKFGEGEWSLPDGAEYADMTLVEAGLQFIPAAGTHYVKMVYETLTAAWVLEEDEDTDYGTNGLKRITRTLVALPDTAYTDVVGTTAITSDGTTLFLGTYKIIETDAKWTLQEVWLEAGTLSTSNDFVGSQLSIVIESFRETPGTPGGYVLAKADASDVEGIPTNRYIFLKHSILSQTEDLVGSQLAIIIEAFGETPSTPAGYTLAKTDTSDVEGIPTKQYTFLRPSILSRSFNDLSDGVQEVTVTTFGGAAHGLAGPVIKETTQDEGGIETVSTTVLQDGNGSSIGGSQIEFGMLYPFTYPGVVSLSTRQLSGISKFHSYTAYDFQLDPPVQANVPATTRITFTTNPEISPVGEIWSPTSWAQGYVVGIGWRYSAFAVNKAFRGYRCDPPGGDSIGGTAGEEQADKADEVEWPMVAGNRIFQGTSFEVAIEGGPDDPSGNEYTLSYKTSQAFTDINSVQYYRHELVYATV